MITIGGKAIDFASNELITSDLCQIYSIDNDNWTMLPSLNVRRSNACACLFRDRYIYVFGGDNLHNYTTFSIDESIERLDLAKGEAHWEELCIG